MKNTNKKGFTLVELVVVIAVIAILAGVLIATFASVIKRANQSADIQNIKNAEIAQKADDIIKKIEEANWFGWEDFEVSLVEKLTKAYKDNVNATIDSEEIKKAINDAVTDAFANMDLKTTDLTAEQVKAIVENALGTVKYEGVTEAQVRAIVKAATSELTASQLTPAQVRAIVNAATTNNLTQDDVARLIGRAGLATNADVNAAVETIKTTLTSATSNLATKEQAQDILDAINNYATQLTSNDLDDVITAKSLNIRIKNAGLTSANTPYEVFEAISFEVVPTKTTILLSLEEQQFGFFVVDTNNVLVNSCGLNIAVNNNIDKIVVDPYQYWAFVDSITSTGFKYSQYLRGTDKTDPINIDTGLDVGQNTDITAVNYTSTTGNSVVIRTNSYETNLYINASEDNVRHYGLAGTTTIESISDHSYYEYGRVFMIDIKNGRLVITNYEGAKVESIYLSATNDNYVNIILAVQQNAQLPGLIRRQSVTNPTIVENKKLIAKIQEVNQTGTVVANSEELIYLYAESTVKELIKAYVGVSQLGTMVLEAPSDSEEPGVTTEIKVAKVDTKDNTRNEGVSNSLEKESDNVYLINNVSDLLKLGYMVNGGLDTTGKTYKLTSDIDLNNQPWTPIGYLAYEDTTESGSGRKGKITNDVIDTTNSRPFRGVFDGQNHTIYSLKISHPYSNNEIGLGLFGLVVGSTPNAQYYGTSKADTYVYNDITSTLDETKFADDNYEAVIKNFTIDSATIVGSTEFYVGTVCGVAFNAAIDNCDVSALNMTSDVYTGGIVGTIGDSLIKNCDVNSGSITCDRHQIGGIVGALDAWMLGSSSVHSAVLGCTNRANVSGLHQVGGIVGYAQSARSGIIANCTNYGDISLNNGSYSTKTVGGICGWGTSICLYYHCTNHGDISGANSSNSDTQAVDSGVQVGGISVYVASTKFINCINYGNLSGYANSMGGIISTAKEGVILLENCASNGDITNNVTTDGATGKYCARSGSATLNFSISGTLATLEPVQEYVNGLTSSTIDLTSLTVEDKTGVLSIPSTCATLYVDSDMCEKVSIGERNALTKIYAPGVEVIITGNNTAETKIYEADKVTVNSGVTLSLLSIKNVNETINNGNINNLVFFSWGTNEQKFKSYFENIGQIGVKASSNVPISFVASSEPVGEKGARYAVINFYNRGAIRTTNENGINLISDGVTETTINLYLGSGSTVDTNKRIARTASSSELIKLFYDSNASVSPNFAIMYNNTAKDGRQHFTQISQAVFDEHLNEFKNSDFPFSID